MRRKFDPEQARLSGQRGERLRTPRLDGTFDPLRARASIVEPKVTGPVGLSPVAVRKRGNIEVANLHVGQGRKQLAMLRMAFDVADRVEYDEEGLYWVRRSQQADGTTITTRFNERMQEVVIDSPFPPVPEEGERDQPRPRLNPYLWVGARVNFQESGVSTCGELWSGWWSYGLVVAEPGENGIIFDLGNQPDWQWPGLYTRFPGTPLDFGNDYFDAQQQIDGVHFYWYDSGPGWCFPPGLEDGWTEQRFGFLVDEDADASYDMQRFSRSGGRMYDARWGFHTEQPDTQYLRGPHDPIDPDYAESDYRVPEDCYSSEYGDFLTPTPWTSVFVVDPDEGGTIFDANNKPIANEPSSKRPEDAATLDWMLEQFGRGRGDMLVTGEDGENKYVIKVVGFGAQPFCEGTPYTPTVVDIEVRSAKQPHTRTFRKTYTVEQYRNDRASTLPFGSMGGGCTENQVDGPGTMCGNWMQGAILADVWGNIEEVDYYQPDWMPGGYPCPTIDPDPHPILFLVSWCGFNSVMNWMTPEGCTDVADCIGEALSYPIAYFNSATFDTYCYDQVPSRSVAVLTAGWQALMGTVDPYGYAAAIYDPYTNTWSPAPSSCSQTCWQENDDGCLEQYTGPGAFSTPYSTVDGRLYVPIVPGVYCNYWQLWYDGCS
jgi:hypothetical protein